VPAAESESESEPEPDSTSRRRLRHDDVTRLATDRIRADLMARPGARSVVVAHTFVEGGVTCESERELTVGNIESVGVDAFSGFDLVALGHLHGSQERDGARVAYSGTPLPYSFSEEGQTKSVRIVEIAPDAALTVEVVPLGVGRSLRTIEGTIDDLLSRTEFVDAEPARVRVFLTDTHLPLQAMARLRERFPYAAELRHRPEGVEPGSGGATERDTADPTASPLALTMRFWAEQHGADAGAAEAELLTTALDAGERSRDR
jgi:exonuclease SbcD